MTHYEKLEWWIISMVDCVIFFLPFNPPFFLHKETCTPVNILKIYTHANLLKIYNPTALKYTPLLIITY